MTSLVQSSDLGQTGLPIVSAAIQAVGVAAGQVASAFVSAPSIKYAADKETQAAQVDVTGHAQLELAKIKKAEAQAGLALESTRLDAQRTTARVVVAGAVVLVGGVVALRALGALRRWKEQA